MKQNNIQYIVNDVKDITPTTRFLELLLKNGVNRFEVDIQALMKAPVHADNAWINVTPILKAYNTTLRNWLRSDSAKEYINLVNDEFFNSVILTELKMNKIVPFPKSQWYLKEKFDWLNQDCPLICTRRGKYNSGTYLHKELFIEFITTLDVKLRREMHKMVMSIIQQADVVKVERMGTKTAFHELTDTIKDIYIPAQKSENKKKFAYPTLMTLANIKVLGMKAEKYCRINNIEITDDMISVRDALPEDKLELIKKAEEYINGYIKYGGITDYDTLKEKLLGVDIRQ